MNKLLVMIALLFICAGTSTAQKGVAEPDYYPQGFSGTTWSGEVTSANEDMREFTLTYKKDDKEQTFVGVLPKGYAVKMKDGSDYEVKMEELMGMRLKAYFITKNKKVNGQQVKTNEVFKIKFLPQGK